MKEAREQLIAMLDVYERETKTPGERIVLGGFSQGSMLATDVALHTKRPLAGLVVMSGHAARGERMAAAHERPQGPARLPESRYRGPDPAVPDRRAIASRPRRGRLRVSFTEFEGGHGIPPEVMRDLGTWLKTA